MRTLSLALLASLSACGADTVTLRGELHPDAQDGAGAAWAVGHGERVALTDGAFSLADLPAGPLDVGIAFGDEVAHLTLADLPDGGEVVLHRIRREGDRAFPGSVTLSGSPYVTVNGVRMGSADALPDRVEQDATLLAFGEDADALLVRPAGDALQDLRVVVGPATDVVTPDGDPIELDRLSYGDSVRVVGPARSGYVVAERIVVPRRLGLAGDDDREEASDRDPRGGEGPVVAAPPAATEGPAPRRTVVESESRAAGRAPARQDLPGEAEKALAKAREKVREREKEERKRLEKRVEKQMERARERGRGDKGGKGDKGGRGD